ncbi:MAG TPA: DUF1820 family protein [Thermoanaerobaculales bacterium]|nr:DUF1820 family protein [Thermoanaerobaculales bacterium]HPA81110.1 DUF1820 family protein [Thermoanaerobaculales bacterium]HQL30698.1 DUF1820 family protein [Thermoanaerobaculales bacterium]HQN96645.1 DUF1820 family protein [Thermoanaerobaculales bacterium]HQP43299.1 DUF1820 family protein [Thermoanaerobaculales bacterium]
MTDATIYRITFVNRGEVYEIYARRVTQGGMFGFVEVEELLFGERSKLLIDSSEERLKSEFEGVRRIFIPLHSVVRVDEVDKAGRGRISSSEGTVTSFPLPYAPPGKKPKKE